MALISLIAVRALAAAVESAGVERTRFLSAAGVAEARLDDRSGFTLEEYGRIVTAALSTTEDPALGLHMGEVLNTSHFDALGHLAEHSANLREALQVGMKYGRIVTQGPQLELSEHGDCATLYLRGLEGSSPSARIGAEFATISLVHLVRRFVGRTAQPRAVFFAYEAPAHRSEYARLFACRERFGHSFTGLELERAWLDCAHPCPSPELGAMLKARADLLLVKLERDVPVAERVTRWLEAQGSRDRPSMNRLAQESGRSVRSLRRRLRLERASFAELTAAASAERAKQLLVYGKQSVQETAYTMGFNSPAAFSRAFKRWTGSSPNAYRRLG